MAKYRLVATDLDGTLLDQHGELSARTKAAVAALRRAHIVVALATSRRLTGTAPVAEALMLSGPLILYDGAHIRHYPSGEILREERLDATVAQRAVETIVAHGLRPVVQHADISGEYLLVGPPGPRDESSERYLTQFGHQAREVTVADLCQGDVAPLRIVVFAPRPLLEELAPAIVNLPCGSQLLPQGNYGTAELSIFAPLASKGNALLTLAKRLGIPREQTLAIGDGVNDISMLSMAGLGIAMGNSSAVVREAARAVTSSHDHDGFAEAIERYVLASFNVPDSLAI